MCDLTPDDIPHVCDILGQTDAIWAPVRGADDGSRSNVYFARREYPDLGIRWDSGAVTDRGRKAKQRWVEAAAGRGLVERPQGGTVYSIRVKLTEPAELAARRVCGLAGLAAAVSLVREVMDYERPADHCSATYPDVWVPEWPELCGPEAEPEDLRAVVEEMAYPALLRGWLVANSTVRGQVRYKVGDVPDPLPEFDDDDADDAYDPAARAVWLRGLRSRLAALAVADEVTRREIGSIALPVSDGYVKRRSDPAPHPWYDTESADDDAT